MNSLPRVRAGLLSHQLDGQLLIYDACDDRVHLLDTTTGHVFELLEEGGRGHDGIVAELAIRMNAMESESLLQLSLEELRKADLLEEVSGPIAPLSEINRREALRKVGVAGAGVLLIPAIATLTASRAYAQTSCLTLGEACQADGPACCAGLTCRITNPTTGSGDCVLIG